MQMVKHLAIIFQILVFSSFFTSLADPNATAKDLKFNAILMWGTNGEKPKEDPPLKDVDGRFQEKLRSVLKWKNYYEINRVPFAIKVGEKKTLDLSPKCKIVAEYSEVEGIKVELIGEGKSLFKATQSMPLKEPLVLGGNAEDETAWVVVIKAEHKK